MAYSTISKPSLHFNTKLYTGTGATQSITGLGFQPDWCWIKSRDTGNHNHNLIDVVRAAPNILATDGNSAQWTNSTDGFTAFGTDGFTLGANTAGQQSYELNKNNDDYVSWNWKAGNSAGSTNNDGSVTSTVSANTTAGFSIVKFNYPSSGNFTFGHGLGVAPRMFILRGYTGTANWQVYHQGLGNTYNTQLNFDSATSTAANWWGSTSPTSTVCTVGADLIESGQTAIAYCFAEKKGYSKFDKYTGNGDTNGTFIYTGFKPAWVMFKRTDNSSNWHMQDNKRIGYNQNNYRLYADVTDAETTSGVVDFLSNGFKFRATAMNTNNGTFIYMAFAEEPLVANVGTSGIPATAR